MLRIAQGKSVVHVQASEISKIEISYPDPETQIRIIKVLEAISNRIESCEKELNHLTKMRNSLLQQLLYKELLQKSFFRFTNVAKHFSAF
ncbi:MAG: restriction endonuclease subunit S [Subdoligranulum sp.]